MKKVFAMLLALVLVFSLSTAALATGIEGSTSQDIVVDVSGGAVHNTRCVIITWGNMTFDYVKGDKTWNPETEEYDEAEGFWEGGNTSTVTVTNKSDVAVTVGVSTNDKSETDGFATTVDTTGFTLESYFGRATADSRVINVTVDVDGDPAVGTGIAVSTVALAIS